MKIIKKILLFLGILTIILIVAGYFFFKNIADKVDNFSCGQYLQLIDTDANWDGNNLKQGAMSELVNMMPILISYEMHGSASLKWVGFADILTDTCRQNPIYPVNSLSEDTSRMVILNNGIEPVSERFGKYLETLYPINGHENTKH